MWSVTPCINTRTRTSVTSVSAVGGGRPETVGERRLLLVEAGTPRHQERTVVVLHRGAEQHAHHDAVTRQECGSLPRVCSHRPIPAYNTHTQTVISCGAMALIEDIVIFTITINTIFTIL